MTPNSTLSQKRFLLLGVVIDDKYKPERFLHHDLTSGEYAAHPDVNERDHFSFGGGRRIWYIPRSESWDLIAFVAPVCMLPNEVSF
jgi:hypothetical protein